MLNFSNITPPSSGRLKHHAHIYLNPKSHYFRAL
uniref:Uncharacterized protein n=1 Tax=Anguilla anguilla TaxID=7936 RepID=A0A0E9TAI2_ANGAN